jgi:2-pyrone-4,6-dicarboxylate lactonase
LDGTSGTKPPSNPVTGINRGIQHLLRILHGHVQSHSHGDQRMSAEPRAPTTPGPDPEPRPPKIKLPSRACDCHAHVFGPQSRYPYAPNAAYIPPDALPANYVRMLRTIGCERAVLVQPSIYGTDNALLLDTLRADVFTLRGVVVVDSTISDKELQDMHRVGVRGVRVNLAAETPGPTLDHAQALGPRLKALGWHMQFYLDLKQLPAAATKLGRLPINVVIDHFGRLPAADGVKSPAFLALLRLLRGENCWAKLMGPYLISDQAPGFPDVAPLAKAVVAAAPDRVVWGSDWPHPGAGAMMPNDGTLADMLNEWVPDERQRHKILVENPARLYGF